VIATHPAERTLEVRRVVTAHLDTARAQAVPERARRLAETSHPIVEQAHAHAFVRPFDQRVGEQPPLSSS